MQCRRCRGVGVLTPRLGKPGFESRDGGTLVETGKGWSRYEGGGYRIYNGTYCLYPKVECYLCLGFGNERDKPNKQAGKRVVIDDED